MIEGHRNRRQKLTAWHIELKIAPLGPEFTRMPGFLFLGILPIKPVPCSFPWIYFKLAMRLWVYHPISHVENRTHFNSQFKDARLLKWAAKNNDGDDDITMIYRTPHFCWGCYCQSSNYHSKLSFIFYSGKWCIKRLGYAVKNAWVTSFGDIPGTQVYLKLKSRSSHLFHSLAVNHQTPTTW